MIIRQRILKKNTAKRNTQASIGSCTQLSTAVWQLRFHLYPMLQTPDLKPKNRNPKTQTPEPQTLSPKIPKPLNPHPQSLNLKQ